MDITIYFCFMFILIYFIGISNRVLSNLTALYLCYFIGISTSQLANQKHRRALYLCYFIGISTLKYFITQILVSNYILTFRHQSMPQLLKLIQSNQIVLKHSFLIITSRFLGFVTMSNHMVLKHCCVFHAIIFGFVTMSNHMVLKPQTQYLMSGNIHHHSASKYTAYICMTKVALRHLIILFF